nr:hypothetical protein Iba_chr11bCG12540 [Ipomoea batatas]
MVSLAAGERRWLQPAPLGAACEALPCRNAAELGSRWRMSAGFSPLPPSLLLPCFFIDYVTGCPVASQ